MPRAYDEVRVGLAGKIHRVTERTHWAGHASVEEADEAVDEVGQEPGPRRVGRRRVRAATGSTPAPAWASPAIQAALAAAASISSARSGSMSAISFAASINRRLAIMPDPMLSSIHAWS